MRTVLVFVFYLLMLTVAVFCCSGCTQAPAPVSVDKVQIRNHSAQVLAEQTRVFNERMERQALEGK
jgi:outer membrane lipoprotein-sorting protein